ncbi:unnamed protein product [Acanthoscelides obtectus]|uniref:PiggyBac transposable element-derived protein domain-containing protein n=1 Tax=Acanthoscelides obtectus TaxID=200917 RepID=A0A9P0NZN6_ACAOB|nr:unnamed protein product [Acanthoscelides obtectus]CAK1640757.1 PiggyBac transposable element-derived protein 4 [Acanthoscelides obtectus]
MRLMKLWNELLSDEEEQGPSELMDNSSDDYLPSHSSSDVDSDTSSLQLKPRKKKAKRLSIKSKKSNDGLQMNKPVLTLSTSDFATAVNSSRSNIIHPSTDSETDDSWQEINPRKKTKRSNNVEMPTVILGSNHRVPQPSTSRDANIIPKEQRQSTIDEVIDEVIAQFCLIDSENESDEDPLHDELHWIPSTSSHLKKFIFDLDHVGVTTQISEDFITKAPYDFFKIFLSDELLDLIVLETNRYARQCENKPLAVNSRLHRRRDTNRVEITTFFGIVMYMGLARLPKMTDYWSKNPLYSNKVSCKMSRNRFELLLRVLHFNDNEIIDKNDRLGKLSPLLENLTNKFKEVYVPEKSVCIDETLVPFRGRLSFRQYIKNKRFKFGIKLYKLCCKDGYTYDIKVYCGKDKHSEKPATVSTVLSLMEPLLDHGRILYTGNYYTSVSLAHELQKRVVVLKWHDKRDILCLSTVHTETTTKYTRRGTEIEKPSLVVDYNSCKSFIDLSDQLKSYCSPLRKGVKWYRKLAFEILLGSAVVNAFILYKTVTKAKISITEFRQKIALGMLQIEEVTVRKETENENRKHVLQEVASKGRRKCVACYAKISIEEGRKAAQKKGPKSKIFCDICNKFYCLSCFFDDHNYSL